MIKAAAILVLALFAATGSALGQERHWPGHGHRGGGHAAYGHPGGSGWHRGNNDAVGGFLGGILGGYLWRQFNQPDVVVVPQEPVRDVAWCMQRYRSYDPYTRTYLGFDGLRHGCP
jgi:hypothetical protein